jgi:hydrogenase maturation protein HypF
MDRGQQGVGAFSGKAALSGDAAIERVRITIGGRVQGVGFRPSVYRHAVATGMTGFVRNTVRGVQVEAQGSRGSVRRFLACLRSESPRQAHVESMEVVEIPAVPDEGGFQIVPSARSGDLLVGFPPDLATCSECVRELFTVSDRRYRYPFINCVNCGPRFTIIAELPYDRAATSMSVFPLCTDCRREYEDPRDRRFDAQPNACPVCGPRLFLLDEKGRPVATEDPLASAVNLLKSGKIVAVKGVGGFHLCCDAKNDDAVLQLRTRKGRRDKPFAVMFSSCEQIGSYTAAGPDEIMELLSPAAPVVVIRRKPEAGLSKWIAPDTADVGVLLPYSPLHYLLLHSISPLVMTSGNISEEPIAHDERTLGRILGRVADAALTHNRAIVRRCDDSVIKMVGGRRLMLRRSRGFAPQSVLLPFEGPPVLAVGAELKNTFCMTRGNKAFLSQHIGDLVEHPGWMFFLEAVEDLAALLKIKPLYVAHDLHPAYESTRFAQSFPPDHRMAVQHHHAHIVSCMAEHGLTGPVLGVAFDGSGMGDDQTIWGGEFLVADYRGYRRAARVAPFRLPGGDEAIRHPPRTAVGVLFSVLGAETEAAVAQFLPSLRAEHRGVLLSMLRSNVRAPITTSAGRLFDAVAALLGLCDAVTYEGQAAVRLQTLASKSETPRAYALECAQSPSESLLLLDYSSLVRDILEDLDKGVPRENMALGFHYAMADGIAKMCRRLADAERLDRVVLCGGVFQNELLLRLTEAQLRSAGLAVYWPHDVPPNDGGVSLGQAAVALARLAGS